MKHIQLTILSAMVLAGLLLLAFGPRGNEDIPPGRVVVDYWEKWTGTEGDQMKEIVDEFNNTVGKEKNIYVRFLSMSTINQKTLVATAGGVPPDIAGLWAEQVSQFSSLNAVEPLDPLLAEYNEANKDHPERQLTEESYKPVYWKGCHYDGKLCALVSTPAAIALHYNKRIFEQEKYKLIAADLDYIASLPNVSEADKKKLADAGKEILPLAKAVRDLGKQALEKLDRLAKETKLPSVTGVLERYNQGISEEENHKRIAVDLGYLAAELDYIASMADVSEANRKKLTEVSKEILPMAEAVANKGKQAADTLKRVALETKLPPAGKGLLDADKSDPIRPPRTINELDAYAAVLDSTGHTEAKEEKVKDWHPLRWTGIWLGVAVFGFLFYAVMTVINREKLGMGTPMVIACTVLAIGAFQIWASKPVPVDPKTNVPTTALKRAGYLPLVPGWYQVYTPYWFNTEMFVYDEKTKTGKLNYDDPKVLEAYEWMGRYRKRMGAQMMGSFQSSMGNFDSPQNPFVVEQVVMEQQGPWLSSFIEHLKPSMNRWHMPPEDLRREKAFGEIEQRFNDKKPVSLKETDAIGPADSSTSAATSPAGETRTWKNVGLYGWVTITFANGKATKIDKKLRPAVERQKFCEWAAAPFPTPEGVSADGKSDVAYASFDTLIIPRGAKHKKEAFEFIAYINRQDVQEKLCSLHCKNSVLRKVSEDFIKYHPNPYIQVFEDLAASPRCKGLPSVPTWPEVDAEMNMIGQRIALDPEHINPVPKDELAAAQKKLQKIYEDFLARQKERQAKGLDK